MSYANNPTSILAGSGITVSPTTGSGARVITISSSGIVPVAVRVAVATPVVASATTDEVISIQVPGAVPVAVTLPGIVNPFDNNWLHNPAKFCIPLTSA